jgi:rhamnosyltransferase
VAARARSARLPLPVISIVIPVRNGGPGLRRLLEAIRVQNAGDDLEIVVVDSGSTDGSQELARSFGARVHEIAPGEFNHGATRNLGAELTEGETIVFTVDDALPLGEHWLDALTAPLREDNRLAGTYSRQIARDDAPAHQRYYVDYRFGPTARVQRAARPEDLGVATVLFSNVSSAIRRSVWERFPFPDDVMIAEDLAWCGRVLLAGCEVAYVPESVVRHSHPYTLGGVFRRFFDQGVAAEHSVLGAGRSSARAVRGEGLRFVREELRWLWRSDERGSIPYAVAYELTRYTGFALGVHHRLLPVALRRRLSRLPLYWDQPAVRRSS